LSMLVKKTFDVDIAPHHMFSRPDLNSLVEKIIGLNPDLKSQSSDFQNHSLTSSGSAGKSTIKQGELSPETAEISDLIQFVTSLSEAEMDQILMTFDSSTAGDHA